jgi:hypothetical protein
VRRARDGAWIENIFVKRKKFLRYLFLFLNRFHFKKRYRGRGHRYRNSVFAGANPVFWNRTYCPVEICKISGRINELDAAPARLQSILKCRILRS